MTQGWLTIVKQFPFSLPVKKVGQMFCNIAMLPKSDLYFPASYPDVLFIHDSCRVCGASTSHCLPSHIRISDIGTDSCLKRLVTDFIYGSDTGIATKDFHNSVFLILSYLVQK
ncbi:hypothetical protein FKM82_020518 [Ascaphus truei]